MSLGESRDALLARVRAALGRSGAFTVPPPPPADDAIMRTVAPDADLTRTYEEAATRLGLKVRRTRRANLARDFAQLLAEKNIRRAAATVQAAALAECVRTVLAAAGVETLDPGQAGFHAHFDVDAGISDVALAIAESGTLVHAVGRGRGRAPTGVPPLHVVLLPAGAIVPDLLDYFATLRGLPGRELPSSLLLISGPSKTADIEGVLVTGIHGPNEVIVLLIEDA